MLARLVSNSSLCDHLPQPPKVLELQARATVPGLYLRFKCEIPQQQLHLESSGLSLTPFFSDPTQPHSLGLLPSTHDSHSSLNLLPFEPVSNLQAWLFTPT